jgi:hypothetical protein
MIDSINLRLNAVAVGDVDLIELCARYLSGTAATTSTEVDGIGQAYKHYSNTIDNLTVRATANSLFVGDGSLCKFMLGDNIQMLTRKDIQQAIEKLSDILHLPMKLAKVTRLDIGANIPTNTTPEKYMCLFGRYKRAKKRITQDANGIIEAIEYITPNTVLAIYNKIRELKAHGGFVPPIYEDANLLRIEQRFMSRVSNAFNDDVNAEKLYSELFYMRMIQKLYQAYKAIYKNNVTNVDVSTVKDVADLKTLALASLIDKYGLTELQANFKQEMLSGKINSCQLSRINKALNEASQTPIITSKHDAIVELDNSFRDTIRYYL